MPSLEEVKNRDFYDLLGVERTASVTEIKEAYREIARIYHPDSGFYDEIMKVELTDDDQKIFQLVTAAYDTLIKKEKREQYDRKLGPASRDWNAAGQSPIKHARAWNAPSSNESVDLLRAQRMKERGDTGFGKFSQTQPENEAPYTHFGRESRFNQEVFTMDEPKIKLNPQLMLKAAVVLFGFVAGTAMFYLL